MMPNMLPVKVIPHGWLKGIDNALQSGTIIFDFSAAFDLIDHKLLIDKVKCYGFGFMAVSRLPVVLRCLPRRHAVCCILWLFVFNIV